MTETVRYSDVLRLVSATQPRSVFGGSVRMCPVGTMEDGGQGRISVVGIARPFRQLMKSPN
jgi:hypothetical protein